MSDWEKKDGIISRNMKDKKKHRHSWGNAKTPVNQALKEKLRQDLGGQATDKEIEDRLKRYNNE